MGFKTELGRFGEDIAAAHLIDGGCSILDRNWRCRTGEIDIVVKDGRDIVFVEVKTRSGVGFGTPAEAITWDKAARLRKLAVHWLLERRPVCHPQPFATLRFDVVSVLRTDRGPRVDHIRGAF